MTVICRGPNPAYIHSPTDVLSYEFDWSEELGDDTVSASTWTPDDGIVVESDSQTTTTTTVKVSAADAALFSQYQVVNQITSAGGSVERKTLTLIIEEQ